MLTFHIFFCGFGNFWISGIHNLFCPALKSRCWPSDDERRANSQIYIQHQIEGDCWCAHLSLWTCVLLCFFFSVFVFPGLNILIYFFFDIKIAYIHYRKRFNYRNIKNKTSIISSLSRNYYLDILPSIFFHALLLYLRLYCTYYL